MLSATGLTKRFSGTTAVSGLNLMLQHGEITGLLGPNGAGKTTTLRMLLSIIDPDEGEILHKGKPRGSNFKDITGYLPEERGVYKQVTVATTVKFFAHLKGLREAEATAAMYRLADELAMRNLLDRRTDELSKGNQQRVQLMICLINNPEIIILDEPLSGLDPENQEILQAVLHRLKTEKKLILISTHHLELAENICNHVVLLSKGRELISGSPSELTMAGSPDILQIRTSTPLPEGFLCRSAVNVIGDGDGYRVELYPGTAAEEFISQLPEGTGLLELKRQRYSLRDAYHSAMKQAPR